MNSLKKLNGLLAKANVPEGVDPDKYESCVQQVKAEQGEKVNPWAICAASLKKETTHASGVGTESKYPTKPDMGKSMKKSALDKLKELTKADTPSTAESPDTVPTDKDLGPAIKRLKQMGETFQNAPRQEDQNVIAAVQRHPFERLQNIIGDMKEAAVYKKSDSYHKMKKKDYNGYMGVQQAVERILDDKHEVQDILPNVAPEDRDDVLRILRQKKEK